MCPSTDPAVRRGELTETAWERMALSLPRVDRRGRPWRNHRQVVNGVLWRLRTGASWRDVPERYGPWQTVYERFARRRRTRPFRPGMGEVGAPESVLCRLLPSAHRGLAAGARTTCGAGPCPA